MRNIGSHGGDESEREEIAWERERVGFGRILRGRESGSCYLGCY